MAPAVGMKRRGENQIAFQSELIDQCLPISARSDLTDARAPNGKHRLQDLFNRPSLIQNRNRSPAVVAER
jgi:hypothetical protein